jgi:Ca2+-transporting ATPase
MATTEQDMPVPAVWHTLPAEQAVGRLTTDERAGLTAAEAASRLAQHGPNELREGARRGPLAMLLGQFTDLLIVILLAAALVSGLVGDLTDTIVILAIVVINALVGFIQEYRAERAVAALKAMAAPHAHVLRDGHSRLIPAPELVPGDIVLLEAGNAVPADLRLTEVAQLRVEEAALTGESEPVEKHTRALEETDAPIGDRRNMAYKGTLVTYGRGKGLVVATGMATELGRIAELLHGAEEVKTPLQRRLARFGRVLAYAILGVCAVMFITGLLRGEPLVLMLLTAVSLAVAAIPEALPAVVTVALALGAAKMVRKQSLIRKLPAVETLGSVTFICSDKTGTLTQNRMRVEEFYADGELVRGAVGKRAARDTWAWLLRALALSNDAKRHAHGAVIGDPTEVALYEAAADAGFDKQKLAADSPRLAELAFDSERARMTTLHGNGADVVAYVKGAPETLLPRCSGMLTRDGVQVVSVSELERTMERMAGDGLRVLAVAFRRLPAVPDRLDPESIESELTFLGLVGLMDPPRPEAQEAIALCMTAGITPVMITGDHPATARAVARRLGIIGDGAEVVTGQQLARASLEEFEQHVERVRVYARVAPEQKIKIVQALQDKGDIVAMTGDGVNDAPALKRADIGVAMGRIGTDVAREAAHMVLLDDNFASIVGAVREGRRIYDNIRKFIRYIMTGNSGEIGVLFLAPFFGMPLPLLPIHLLWVNMVTDGLPSLALAVEPEERHIMRRPPRPPKESLFAHGLWQQVVWVGALITALCLIAQAWTLRQNGTHWQTMVFNVLTFAQMFLGLAVRSDRESLFTQGLLSNWQLLVAVALTFVLQFAIIYVPALNPIFHTEPLSAEEFGFSVGMAALVFVAVEIEKWMIRRGWLYTSNAK